MDLQTFERSLASDQPPELSSYLLAMWYDAKGDWNTAHDIVNDKEGAKAAWVHAYLHRKEGDKGNAAYWYARAGKPVSTLSFDAEWKEIINALL